MGNKAYKDRHKEQGLCRFCSEKAIIKGYCQKHYSNQKQTDRRYYRRNSQKRIDYKTRWQKKHISEGKCMECGIKLIEGEGLKCVNCAIGAHER